MRWLNHYRMRSVVVGAVAVLMLGGGSAKADTIWKQKADMPTARWMHASTAVNGKIYVIGGRPNEGDRGKLSTVEEYDPATDTWTRTADMPTGRHSLSTSVVSAKIYAIGGTGGPSAVEEYNAATDTWARKADMPTGRRALSTCVVNGKIYAIGGMTPGIFSGLRTVEEYDPVTDTWTRRADMPLGVWGLCACVVRGKIYALGGRPELSAQPCVQEYDPATDTWTRKGDMLVGTSQMASGVLGDKIIVIGGWEISNKFPYTTVQVYDPETDIWAREADAPFLRACFSASVVNNRIYVIGGTDRPHPCPATSTVYEFDIGYIPVHLCDFNGDGIVDSADMAIMVDNWGTDNQLCDIGPMPWGDGIVDVQDLIVLAEHLFTYPGAVAHWKLDEAEGILARDDVSSSEDIVTGGALWQPTGGKVGGALELDGADDCLITTFALNPADPEMASGFSIFAWIKGGGPGQTIMSEPMGTDWLLLDAEGKLVTDLKSAGNDGVALSSQTAITDGTWHRIGFVWDGSQRILYVDGIVVAEDRQDGLEASASGLYIGVGNNYAPGSFFSGLIDDVCIYNRVLSP